MKPRKRTRREFLNELGRYTAGAVGSGVLGSAVTGCGSNAVVDPDPKTGADDPPAPVTAAISGPDELEIPSLWRPVTAEFDGSASTGPTGKTYSWSITKDSDVFDLGEIDLGHDVKASHAFNMPGGYTVKLKVNNTWRVEDVAELKTLVKPAYSLPGTDYPLIAFMVLEGTDHSIHIMHPTGAVTKLVTSHSLFGDRISWEPSGERLLVTMYHVDYLVFSYNLMTGEMHQISQGNRGHWQASWNPKKDWIVYCSDERDRSIDEFCLIRPDGSEHFYLHPAFSSELYSGLYPSWDPEGERFATCSAKFDVSGTGKLRFRVGIFDDLWGTPARSCIPTEDQLMNLLEKYSRGSDTLLDEFYNTFVTAGGAAWSPEGQHILYRVAFGYLSRESHHLLVMSRPDGTGDIEIIAESKNEEGPIRYPGLGGMTWSPDGKSAIFGGLDLNNEGTLYRYTLGEGVSLLYDELNAAAPAWYA